MMHGFFGVNVQVGNLEPFLTPRNERYLKNYSSSSPQIKDSATKRLALSMGHNAGILAFCAESEHENEFLTGTSNTGGLNLTIKLLNWTCSKIIHPKVAYCGAKLPWLLHDTLSLYISKPSSIKTSQFFLGIPVISNKRDDDDILRVAQHFGCQTSCFTWQMVLSLSTS